MPLTAIPPTAMPPTAMPPTAIPPIAIPLTNMLSTVMPPTATPLTNMPPINMPFTNLHASCESCLQAFYTLTRLFYIYKPFTHLLIIHAGNFYRFFTLPSANTSFIILFIYISLIIFPFYTFFTNFFIYTPPFPTNISFVNIYFTTPPIYTRFL
jgi:hypothetical protein